MARRSNAHADAALAAFALFRRLPPKWRLVVVSLTVAAGLVYLLVRRPPAPQTGPGDTGVTQAGPEGVFEPPPAVAPALGPDGSGRFLFCFWNVENLFDDKNDNRRPVDEEYDDPFAADLHLRHLKYDRIASTLARMNNGAGPDVIGCVEMEGVRSAELLAMALNAKLADLKLRYSRVEAKDLDAGRHIAPCLITRLPVESARTRLRGSRLRILETHLRVNGADLCLVVSHWTSQVTQQGGGESTDTGRGKYASVIHETFADLAKSDPSADFLVCGDFNDAPESDSVAKVLRATGDRAAVTPSARDRPLFDLMAGKPADRFGTLWYRGKPLIYDQICVSAGMLDGRGWGCDPDTVRTVTDGLTRPGATRREPWRFGNPEPAVADAARGYSDHFPVTVELTVTPAGR